MGTSIYIAPWRPPSQSSFFLLDTSMLNVHQCQCHLSVIMKLPILVIWESMLMDVGGETSVNLLKCPVLLYAQRLLHQFVLQNLTKSVTWEWIWMVVGWEITVSPMMCLALI